MMDNLDREEAVNRDTFSQKEAVERLYNVEGFTDLEKYIIEKYFLKKGRVLDLGCGTGRTSAEFARNGFDVVGIDLSESMISFAAGKHKNVDFRVMNACSLDFDDNSFDYVVFSFNGLDYIHPYAKRMDCLKEVWRVLKKDGIFIYSSHNALAVPRNRELVSMILKNTLSLRIFSRFRIEDSPTGSLYTYYGLPCFEEIDLKKNGFFVEEIKGRKYKNKALITFLELSPYYVARKSG